MFGYLNVEKERLTQGEYGLWHTFLCGVCLSAKRLLNNSSRLTSNYDINFFNVLFHSYLNIDVEIYNDKCAASPFKKRPLLRPDEITDKLAQANVILMYYNLLDDKRDGGMSLKKRAAFNLLKKPFSKASQAAPQLARTIENRYRELARLGEEDCRVLDMVCEPFSALTRDFAVWALGEENVGEYILNLCYNIGKWIYLIDALDDLEKDYARKNYNPLVACLGGFESASDFVEKNRETLDFVFMTTLNKTAESFNDCNLTKYVCVLKNVIYEFIRNKTKTVFEKYKREN